MIRNLETKTWDNLRGGRYTRHNLVKISDDHVLVANQIYFPGDGIAHKRPGYTLVKALGFSPTKIFDFRRQSDGQQFVILAGGGSIAWMRADGTQLTVLSNVEDVNAVWDFATNTFGLYGSNGINKYKFVDTGNGLLTKFNWGIQAPAAAPTLSYAGGTLTLTYGRQYAFSYVSKWTDASGTTRIHVGPPSPLTASTGPQVSQVVNLAALLASADPQVTHIWIWATNDTPQDTTSVLFFLSEIANGVTTYGDSLADTSLDTTRQIPYDNVAPPAASIIREFNGRFALMGITGKPDLVQGTGLEEIDIGIPQETAPTAVFFNVPGKTKKLLGSEIFNEQLLLGTGDFWFKVAGFSAETFQENDNIMQPGPAGKELTCVTSSWLVWLGKDKKLWAWNGVHDPVEVSWKIARADGSTQLSMESISEALLSKGQLRWFNFGRFNIVALLISTQNNQYFDWCQLWDISQLAGPDGGGPAEGDAFFSDHIIGAGVVQVGSKPYLFLADDQKNVFRWPDGFTDNGNVYGPVVGSEYSDCDAPGMKKRFRWLDGTTSRQDAPDSFLASAVASDGINLDRASFALQVGKRPAQNEPEGKDPSVFRAKLEAAGTSVGRFIRWFVEFPMDDQDCELYKTEVKWSPLGKDTR